MNGVCVYHPLIHLLSIAFLVRDHNHRPRFVPVIVEGVRCRGCLPYLISSPISQYAVPNIYEVQYVLPEGFSGFLSFFMGGVGKISVKE